MDQSQTLSASSTLNASQTFTLDVDVDTQGDRKYPSVKDYYNAKSSDSTLPLQLQPGLSNYSGIQFGDDRITVGESVLSATYRQPVEHLMSIPAPSKNLTKHTRIREYETALKKVGESEINRLERVMKDKLFQRSYATSSPFQVRKAFKFFDREIKLTVPIEGFTRALEFLGFQFTEMQNLALFARYDDEYTGEIPYMEFITNAMFYPAVEPDFGVQKPSSPVQIKASDNIVNESEETKRLKRAGVKNTFDKVDLKRQGRISEDDLDLLMSALGFNLTAKEIESCARDMGARDSIEFDLFYEWWTDPMGMAAMRKK